MPATMSVLGEMIYAFRIADEAEAACLGDSDASQ
jgi:hypothetical protein